MAEAQHNDTNLRPEDQPRVPGNRRVYAIGDIHGRADLLDRLHAQIREDAAASPDRTHVLIYLGDYVDRGPNSYDVVESLIKAPQEGFEIVHLKGNHEDFLLTFLEDPSVGGMWAMNGGNKTLRSYKVGVFDLLLGSGGREKVRRRFAKALPPSHLAFFEDLARYHVEGDYVFVHAGIRPGVALEDQEEKDLLWIREDFLFNESDPARVVVHGHTIHWTPDLRQHRIGIDTGAFHSGHLTCLVLDGTDVRFLQT